MKALSLTQPWATLVATGAKRYETRSWQTSYRGYIAIHAARNLTPVGGQYGMNDLCRRQPFRDALALYAAPVAPYCYQLPLGAVVAIAKLVSVHPTENVLFDEDHPKHWYHVPFLGEHERAFGDWTPGRWAWRLENVIALPSPSPASGMPGVWNWIPPDYIFNWLQGQGVQP